MAENHPPGGSGRHHLPPLPPMQPRSVPQNPRPILPYKVMETINISNVEMEVADRIILEALDAGREPTNTQIIQADCLFTAMINLLYARLSAYEVTSELYSICLFNINRVNAAKTWLLIFLFHFKNNFYVPTKPLNETIPPLDLEKEPCFPHLNPQYFGNTDDEMLNQLLVSNRLELFMTKIIAKCYPHLTPEEVDRYAFCYTHDVLVLSQLPDLNKLIYELEAAKAAAALAALQPSPAADAPDVSQPLPKM